MMTVTSGTTSLFFDAATYGATLCDGNPHTWTFTTQASSAAGNSVVGSNPTWTYGTAAC